MLLTKTAAFTAVETGLVIYECMNIGFSVMLIINSIIYIRLPISILPSFLFLFSFVQSNSWHSELSFSLFKPM